MYGVVLVSGVQYNKSAILYIYSVLIVSVLLIPFIYFTHPSPHPHFPSGNCQRVLCISESGFCACLFFSLFVCA